MGKKDETSQDRKKLRSLHSEMKDRGLVVEATSEKRRKRRDQRRKTGDVDLRALEKLTKSAKSKSKSQNCVSFAKKLATESSSSPKSDRSVPLKSSLKKSNEFGETSSSGVQSGSANSDADSINAKHVLRKQKRERSSGTSNSKRKTSSESEVEDVAGMLRIKAKERKQRAMEAKVEDSERKLAEFNARLTVRKNKLEDLHSKLKERKQKLKEREEKLRLFEKQISDREEKLRAKAKVVRHHEAALRHEEGNVSRREHSVTSKLQQLEARTTLVTAKEKIGEEISTLAKKQYYQSSFGLNQNNNKKGKSCKSLDDLSDIDSDDLEKQIRNLKLKPVSLSHKQVGLLL